MVCQLVVYPKLLWSGSAWNVADIPSEPTRQPQLFAFLQDAWLVFMVNLGKQVLVDSWFSHPPGLVLDHRPENCAQWNWDIPPPQAQRLEMLRVSTHRNAIRSDVRPPWLPVSLKGRDQTREKNLGNKENKEKTQEFQWGAGYIYIYHVIFYL